MRELCEFCWVKLFSINIAFQLHWLGDKLGVVIFLFPAGVAFCVYFINNDESKMNRLIWNVEGKNWDRQDDPAAECVPTLRITSYSGEDIILEIPLALCVSHSSQIKSQDRTPKARTHVQLGSCYGQARAYSCAVHRPHNHIMQAHRLLMSGIFPIVWCPCGLLNIMIITLWRPKTLLVTLSSNFCSFSLYDLGLKVSFASLGLG